MFPLPLSFHTPLFLPLPLLSLPRISQKQRIYFFPCCASMTGYVLALARPMLLVLVLPFILSIVFPLRSFVSSFSPTGIT
jgi:hypothetical protein